MVTFFLVGGLPTILGGAVGYFYSSGAFTVLFDGLAIGAILYVYSPCSSRLQGHGPRQAEVAYLGIFLGFLVGFIVNLI